MNVALRPISTSALLATLAAPAAFAVFVPSAEARIVCNGNYQLVAGSEISTPYCRDRNLARIARSRGFAVSDREILYSPSRKREICRYVGSNIEVQTACAEVDGRRSPGF